jgi:hypothetical protein
MSRTPKQQHTPTPWRALHCVVDAEGAAFVADCSSHPDWRTAEANAAFIVQTCNNHAALIDAAEDCIADLAHYVSTHGPGPDKRLAVLRAAIQKARGRS